MTLKANTTKLNVNYEAESRIDSVNIKATKCNKSSNENRIQNEMKTSRYANISTI